MFIWSVWGEVMWIRSMWRVWSTTLQSAVRSRCLLFTRNSAVMSLGGFTSLASLYCWCSSFTFSLVATIWTRAGTIQLIVCDEEAVTEGCSTCMYYLVQKVSKLLLSLHNLLPVFNLFIFHMLLLQPEQRWATSMACYYLFTFKELLLLWGLILNSQKQNMKQINTEFTHCMTTSSACPRDTGLLLRKLKSSWWLRYDVASNRRLNSCSTISSFSLGTLSNYNY